MSIIIHFYLQTLFNTVVLHGEIWKQTFNVSFWLLSGHQTPKQKTTDSKLQRYLGIILMYWLCHWPQCYVKVFLTVLTVYLV